MTSEILLMNQFASVIAADSALTLGGPKGRILSNANKIFRPTLKAPIGAMFFNVAALAGVPIETYFKCYRQKYGKILFDTVAQYSEHFLNYIEKETETVRHDNADALFTGSIYSFMDEIHDVYNTLPEEQFLTQCDIWITEVEMYSEGNINESDMVNSAGSLISNVYVEFCDRVPGLGKFRDKILPVLSGWCTIPESRSNYTGIIFTGFGESEMLPALFQYKLEFRGKMVLITGNESNEITTSIRSMIIPLAQSNVMMGVINGIHTDLVATMKQIESEQVASIINQLISDGLIEDVTEKKLAVWESISKCLAPGSLSEIIEKFMNDNALNSIRSLSPSELAETAEFLVGVERLSKTLQAKPAEVGGPIDTAIITKGDGLIWHSRKHYFDPELNRHFFSRYYED